MEKPDPMVSARHQFGDFHRLHMFVGSTLASTCPATFVFAVDVRFFFSWEVVLIHFPPILHFNLGLMCYLSCCPSWFLSALASMKGTLF